MDTLDGILRSVRLETSLLSRARYGAPWAVVTKGAPHPIFHAIVHGDCVLLRRGSAPLSLVEGDVALLPAGGPHTMASRTGLDPVPVPSLFRRAGGRVRSIEHGGPGRECRIICGSFRLDHQAASWLMGQLPELIHMRAREEAQRQWIVSTLAMLDQELRRDEPGGATMAARLTDLLVVQALRHHATYDADSRDGWLAAVRDERVAKALALIHQEPGADWTVPKLAAQVGMSRTRFFARFSKLVGEPPARYLARWRASTAADLLRRRDVSTAELAELVGYASESAFTTVFRRYVGLSPAEYRRQCRVGAVGG